jgi:NADH pyrophosphatase NudC (nudix superfamily)
MLDITAAGHLAAGETVEQGLREVREELGVSLSTEQLHSLGYRVEVADQANGQLNREYQAVYLGETALSPRDFRPQPDEVYGLIGVAIADCFRIFADKTQRCNASGIAFHSDTGSWKEQTKSVGLTDFIPRIQPYYLTVAIMAERLLEGRRPLSIS